VAQFAPSDPRTGFHSYSWAGSTPWAFAKLMHVSPAMAVAKELQAGEIPACVSVSVGASALGVGETVVLTTVVVMLAAVADGMDPALEPTLTQ